MSIFALILSAGFSSRMAPAFKPLLELPFIEGNQTALARVCGLYKSEGVQPLVVGGYRASDTEYAALALGCGFAFNPHPEWGMFSSIQVGVNALPACASAFFVHPVDLSLVRRMTVRVLLEAAKEASESVLIPTFKERAGHPPLIKAQLRPLFRGKSPRDGLRGLLATVPVRHVPTADSFILKDMDKLADYWEFRNLARAVDILEPLEALELLSMHAIPERGMAHARAVGRLAGIFTEALAQQRKYASLDCLLAVAGGLLHDICKGHENHEQAAGMLFRNWGMERMARLVEDHKDICLPPDTPLTERETVFLADKYVHGALPVSLEERFGDKLRIYANDPLACSAIRGRLKNAQAVARRFSQESGHNPEKLAFTVLSNLPQQDISKA